MFWRLLIVGLVFLTSCSGSLTGFTGVDLPSDDDQSSDQPAFVEFFICPQEDCPSRLAEAIAPAQAPSCALYSLTNLKVIEALEKTGADLVLDVQNKEKKSAPKEAVFAPQGHTMHDKFCVLNQTSVITGSYNPSTASHRDLLIRIDHPLVAKRFKEEFDELKSKTFGGGEQTRRSRVNTPNGTLSVYFCPDDECEDLVAQSIEKSTDSIVFQTYSFTSDYVAKAIIEANERGVHVKGVADKSQLSKFSKVDVIKDSGIPIEIYQGSGLMHRKLFIIDSRTIIAGSANPTESGYHSNDENLLIIDDPVIAAMLLGRLGRENLT